MSDKNEKIMNSIYNKKLNLNIQSTENVLLMGAGFTKNVGGLLGSEMWAKIFSHEKIQAQPRIQKLMLNDFDYESVYHTVLNSLIDKSGLYLPIEFTPEEQEAIKIATWNAYEHIDRVIINQICFSDKKWMHGISTFLINFGLLNCSDIEKNCFIFTLNQDLLIERITDTLPDNHPNRKIYRNLSIPGLDSKQRWWFKGRNCKRLTEDDRIVLPNKEELETRADVLSIKESFFLIKLHGSYNWKSYDGSDMMVIGKEKLKQISKEPLLDWYSDIFKCVLSQKQRRLLIVGYSFSDKHINKIISDAVREHELKIYILSEESSIKMKDKLCDSLWKTEDTINIWKGLSGYFQFANEILGSGYQDNPVEKEFFYDSYFGKDSWKGIRPEL